MNKKLLLLVSLATSPLCADLVSPTYVVRSQGSDAARKLAGVSDKVHLYDSNRYVNFSATLEYSRSFDQSKIAHSLFGNDVIDCGTILVQGSAITGDERNAKAWFADYFYLAPDYNASFCITPRISNTLADLDLYVGFDDIVQGLYLRLHGPITHTNWNLNFEESCDIETTGSYNFGYFDSDIMFNNQLLQSFGEFAQGQTPFNTTGATTAQPVLGVQFLPLQYAKIDSCSHSRTGFAELRMELGWDFAQNDDYHFGLNVQVAAPTGNRTRATLAFDPTIGNRNHWETGAGLSAHYTFWRAQGEEKHAGFYIDASVTHMNNAREQRTFDLCGRPNSRYMLAMKMNTPVAFLLADETSIAATNAVTPNSQFQGLFSPVANLTTLDVYVRSGVQADLAVMFNYSGENVSFDFGYNFWARTPEKFSHVDVDSCCPSLCNGNRNQWALKGDAHVYGFTGDNSGTLVSDEAVALSATQCGATIHGGTNATVTSGCTGVSTNQNCGVDNAQYAFASQGGDTAVPLLFAPNIDITEGNQVKTSLEPNFINCCDINLQTTRGLSNKIFAHISYTWDKESWTPYVGIGGFAEFGKNSSDCNPCDAPVVPDCTSACDDTSCCTPCCTDSLDLSLSQWGVWIKGGITFGESYERPKNTNNGRMNSNTMPISKTK